MAAQERAAKDAAKKAAKAEAAEQKQADKLAHSVVTIKRIERNKRKYVTAVIGLEAFGLELKKVSQSSPVQSSPFWISHSISTNYKPSSSSSSIHPKEWFC